MSIRCGIELLAEEVSHMADHDEQDVTVYVRSAWIEIVLELT